MRLDRRLSVAAIAAMATSGGLFWFQVITWFGVGMAGADMLTFTAADQRGLAHGWLHMYDPPGPVPVMFSPPVVGWIYLPLLRLSVLDAYLAFGSFLTVASIAAWWRAAPGGRLERAVWLVVLMGSLPLVFAVDNGQPLPLALLLAALGLRLLRSGQPVGAGAALAVAVQIKPTAALLVGPALLLSSDRRAFYGWLGASAVLVGAYFALLGPGFPATYLNATHQLITDARGLTLPAAGSPIWLLPRLGIVGVVLALAWRAKPEIAVGIGIAGSLLMAPVVHQYDLVLLFPVAWALRSIAAGRLTAAAFGPGVGAIAIWPKAPLVALWWEASLIIAFGLALSRGWAWLDRDRPLVRRLHRLAATT